MKIVKAKKSDFNWYKYIMENSLDIYYNNGFKNQQNSKFLIFKK